MSDICSWTYIQHKSFLSFHLGKLGEAVPCCWRDGRKGLERKSGKRLVMEVLTHLKITEMDKVFT